MTHAYRFQNDWLMTLIGGIYLLASTGSIWAAPIFADFIDETQDVTSFGSGILTGAPDDGGAFLSNTFDPPTNLGFITAGFTPGLTDGPGDDIVIYDAFGGLPAGDEFADVFVSTDGIAFTFLGDHGAGVNSFDLNGVFGGVVHYVKVVNTSVENSPDIDAFQGNYPVPEPSTVILAVLGCLGFVVCGWRHRKRSQGGKSLSGV
jgi:hypothetical protein